MNMLDVDEYLRAQAGLLAPRLAESVVAVPAPGDRPGFWVGGSSTVEYGGATYMAYRSRRPVDLGRGSSIVLADSWDDVHFTPLQILHKEEFRAESLERPALVALQNGRWRLYVSCATEGTKHWRVEMVEASHPAAFDPSTRRVVLPGDEHWGVKDPVIVVRDGLWHLWLTEHPLDQPGQEDRMQTGYYTSTDGVAWTRKSTALSGRRRMWDARGARVTAVRFVSGGVVAAYDGRASAEQNFNERTGVAIGRTPGTLSSISDEPCGQAPGAKALRYLDVAPLPGGAHRIYYEVALPDGSHEVRTELRRA
jgi:hypothetical protein